MNSLAVDFYSQRTEVVNNLNSYRDLKFLKKKTHAYEMIVQGIRSDMRTLENMLEIPGDRTNLGTQTSLCFRERVNRVNVYLDDLVLALECHLARDVLRDFLLIVVTTVGMFRLTGIDDYYADEMALRARELHKKYRPTVNHSIESYDLSKPNSKTTTILIMDHITDGLRNTSLSNSDFDNHPDSEQLLFNPQEGSGFATTALDDIPRYLFRIASPKSDGETNDTWVRSESAKQKETSSAEDIFFNLNNNKQTNVARALNQHLRWWGKDTPDNFVSWTSSLLFAIQYIYYRHLSLGDRSHLRDIKLFVIDTALFPQGTFMRDLELIENFSEYDTHEPCDNLEYLGRMRKCEYYYGEYLSQGQLKIKGKCEIISAQCLFESGRLRRLQPDFREIYRLPVKNGKPDWAKEVNRLRQKVWPLEYTPLDDHEMAERSKAIEEILQELTPSWRFPLAIYFTALIGPDSLYRLELDQSEKINYTFLRHFEAIFPKEEQHAFNPLNFNVVAPETMPELQQVEVLIHDIHSYYERI
ncbi:hypothetical protein N7466_009909 [Penicillium verhagenii]|uniref:uncharacterized protein n=1 Tax=Penicillium verhagenii TaxID=1562060 RepID=UPI002544DC5C|nr:uncharacterized protein N7466_009909 [Penicillium verhagenii]KAJ5918966.1 hypothetical protein N7466_009909 [Penicillium verhagenii]